MDLGIIIEQINKNAAKHIKSENGDYLNDDGLLMCGKCNTPKQKKISLFGQIKTPYCLCRCETEKRDSENKELKQRDKLKHIQQLRQTAFPETDMSHCTFEFDDNQNPKITGIAKRYVDNFKDIKSKGSGLILFGNVGSGKTFISACIANALLDKGYPCLVTNFARLINTIHGMYQGKQAYIDSLNKFDLLVIDDLGAERETEYMGEVVHNIIDNRYRAKLPLIITTNLTLDNLKNPTDIRKQRIYSRLLEMCIPVLVPGKDRRLQNNKENIDYMKSILGI